MNKLKVIGIMFLCFSLNACGSRLFYDNFNSDAVGNPPHSSPPGSPTGDFIYLSAPASLTPQPVKVVNGAGFSGNSLQYSNVNIPLYHRYVGFMSKEITPASQHYWAVWNGLLNLSTNSSHLDVWFGDSHFSPMAQLRFKDGQILLQTSTGAAPSFTSLGTYSAGFRHSIIIKIDKNTSTYALSIFPVGGSVMSSGSRPILTPSALSTLRPTLYMWFGEDAHSNGTYTVDNVVLTESCPHEVTTSGGKTTTKYDCEKLTFIPPPPDF